MVNALGWFAITDPATGARHEFDAGDEVPEEFYPLVGDHLLDEPVDRPVVQKALTLSEVSDALRNGTPEQSGGGLSQADVDDAVAKALGKAREREQAAHDALAALEEPFDPTADGVNAKAVKEYLSGLDRETVAGAAEFERVTAAEVAGDNRSSALVE